MSHKKPSQTFDFFILGVVLLIGLCSYLLFSHRPLYQIISIGLTAIAYVVWGIWHHTRLGNLIPPIIIEYILVAMLALALIASNLLIL